MSQELKDLKKLSRDVKRLHIAMPQESALPAIAYLLKKGWSSGNTVNGSPVSRSRWRYRNKGPWLGLRTAVQRQVDADYVLGFSKEDVREIALDMEHALESQWGYSEIHKLVKKLLDITNA